MLDGKPPLGYEARPPAAGGDSGWADLRHTVMELLRILMLRKWTFFVPFCLTLTGALLFSHRLPRQYQASTVFERRTDVATSTLVSRGSPHKFKALLWSFNFDIVDREAMAEVVDEVGWSKDLPHDSEGRLTPEGENMRRSLAASVPGGLGWKFHLRSEDVDQIELYYTSDDPERARVLVEGIRDTYLRRTRGRIMELLGDARSYYVQKLEEFQAEENRLGEEMLRFQIEYPGIDPTRPSTIAEKLALLESQNADLEQRAWELDADIASREAFVSGSSAALVQEPISGKSEATEPMVQNPRRAELERRIRQFEMEIADLQLTRHMTDRHPRIISLRQAMQEAAEAMASEAKLVPREMAIAVASEAGNGGEERSETVEEVWEMQKAQVAMEIQALRANRQRVEDSQESVVTQTESLQKLREGIFEHQRDYEQLRTELQQARAEVKEWSARLEGLDRTIEVESRNKDMGFSVVVPASQSTRPVSPRFTTVLILSVMLAVGIGVAVVLLAELMDRKFRTINQVVRATSLPVLETIGEVLEPAERRARFVRNVVIRPALAAGLVLAAGGSALAAYTSIEHPQKWAQFTSHLVWNSEGAGGDSSSHEMA